MPDEQAFRSVGGAIPPLADRDAFRRGDHLALATDFLAVTSSWTDSESSPLRAVETGESWHLLKFKSAAGSRAADAKLTTYGQLAYLPGESQFGDGRRNDQEEPITLGLRWAMGDSEGGAEYRSFGNRLDRLINAPQVGKDQEGSEVWVARRIGLVRLRLAHSDLSDNVDRNPALPRTTKDQTALTAELRVPAWPIFGLTYAFGDSEKSWLNAIGKESTRERAAFDSLTGTLYYYGGFWDVSASSSYAQSRDAVRPSDETTSLYHDLCLTFHLLDVVTLSPAVSTGADWRAWSEGRSGSSTASLTLSYDPVKSGWRAWTYVSYATSQSNDHAVDAHMVSVSGGINRDLGKVWSGRASVSLEVGYNQYVDAVTPNSSSSGAFAFLTVKVASF